MASGGLSRESGAVGRISEQRVSAVHCASPFSLDRMSQHRGNSGLRHKRSQHSGGKQRHRVAGNCRNTARGEGAGHTQTATQQTKTIRNVSNWARPSVCITQEVAAAPTAPLKNAKTHTTRLDRMRTAPRFQAVQSKVKIRLTLACAWIESRSSACCSLCFANNIIDSIDVVAFPLPFFFSLSVCRSAACQSSVVCGALCCPLPSSCSRSPVPSSRSPVASRQSSAEVADRWIAGKRRRHNTTAASSDSRAVQRSLIDRGERPGREAAHDELELHSGAPRLSMERTRSD